MWLLLLSFFAGVLTILAPCVLPLLPVILGASVEDSNDKYRPYIIIASLAFSVVLFSLLLKASTVFIGVDPIVWKVFSGGILVWFWIITLFPKLWEKVSHRLQLQWKSIKSLSKHVHEKWKLWSVLVWMSLWPVFSSCSPTYWVILAVILPASFFIWILNLLAYVFGLSLMLLIITLLGNKIIKKLRWASNPKWIFKKVLWVIFILIWVSIITWYDKKVETFVIESGYFDITEFEQSILDEVNK